MMEKRGIKIDSTTTTHRMRMPCESSTQSVSIQLMASCKSCTLCCNTDRDREMHTFHSLHMYFCMIIKTFSHQCNNITEKYQRNLVLLSSLLVASCDLPIATSALCQPFYWLRVSLSFFHYFTHLFLFHWLRCALS